MDASQNDCHGGLCDPKTMSGENGRHPAKTPLRDVGLRYEPMRIGGVRSEGPRPMSGLSRPMGGLVGQPMRV